MEAFRCRIGPASQLNGHPTADGQPQENKLQNTVDASHASTNGTASGQMKPPSSSSHVNGLTQNTRAGNDTESTFATPAHALQPLAPAVASTNGPSTTQDGRNMVSNGTGNELVASTSGAESHCGAVLSLALCGDYVCSSGSDAMIKVWKAGSLEFVRSVALTIRPFIALAARHATTPDDSIAC